jgi:hypothetical protein
MTNTKLRWLKQDTTVWSTPDWRFVIEREGRTYTVTEQGRLGVDGIATLAAAKE